MAITHAPTAPEAAPLEPHPQPTSQAGGASGRSSAVPPAARDVERGDVSRARDLGVAKRRIIAEIKKRIVGQDHVIDLLLTCVFAHGHGLFVGVPGLAKTLLISTLARTLSLRSNRIQFTPDLMPSDITGTDVLDEDRATGQRSFRFVPGPVFTNLLLADEINRTPPKTQAALLESMAEGKVSAGGRTYASRRAPTPCRRRSWIAFCCRSTWATRRAKKKRRSCCARPPSRARRRRRC
jgi:hypothetical protein